MATISELRAQAEIIKNETAEGNNTATRIGNLYNDIIDFLNVLNGRDFTYDDSGLLRSIDAINSAIADLDSTLEEANRLAQQERNRLNETISSLDTRITDKVNTMLSDAAVIEAHAAIIQQGLEGQIQYQSGWDENIEAYLQEVGIWAREGDIIKTQWSQLLQSVDAVRSTVAEVQQDVNGMPTSTQWSELVQKANSIEASVNKLLYNGETTEALQTSINQSITDKVASLNLETMYAKKDTENAKEILEWMYSGLKNETSPDMTFNQLMSAGKSGLNNGISEVRTYVGIVRDGDVLNYVAESDLEAKVNDSITGLYNRATTDSASSTIFSQVKKDSQDIATIVTAATGDYTSASIATKFDNWKSGLTTKSEMGRAIANLVTQDELSGATAGLALESYVDSAVASLQTRVNGNLTNYVAKSTYNSAIQSLTSISSGLRNDVNSQGDSIDDLENDVDTLGKNIKSLNDALDVVKTNPGSVISGFFSQTQVEGAITTATSGLFAANKFTAASIITEINKNNDSSVKINANNVNIDTSNLSVKASNVSFTDTFDWNITNTNNKSLFHINKNGTVEFMKDFNFPIIAYGSVNNVGISFGTVIDLKAVTGSDTSLVLKKVTNQSIRLEASSSYIDLYTGTSTKSISITSGNTSPRIQTFYSNSTIIDINGSYSAPYISVYSYNGNSYSSLSHYKLELFSNNGYAGFARIVAQELPYIVLQKNTEVFAEATVDGYYPHSDMRHKEIVRDFELTIENISSAPSFIYRAKSGGTELYAGTSAQYWQKLLPQAVIESKDENKWLSLDYAKIAAMSVISLAREVVTLKQRVAELENGTERKLTALV